MTTDKQRQVHEVEAAIRRLVEVKRLIENDLPPQPTGYAAIIFTNKKIDGSFIVRGPYTSQEECIVVLVRELDRLYPNLWKLNCPYSAGMSAQFVHVDHGVLGYVEEHYDDWQDVGDGR